MNRSTADNRRSKRMVITIDDDDSTSEQPASKRREREISPEVMQKKITELQQALAKSERNFQNACCKIRETEERVRFLENLIDTKPQVVDDGRKKEEELEKKITELTAKLAQCDGLQQQSPPIQQQYDTQESLFATQISQEPVENLTVMEEAKITEMKLQIKFKEVSNIGSNGVYSQPIEVDGVTWKIRGVHKDKGLNFLLEAENKNEIDYCFPVLADFGVISQKTKKIMDKNKLKEFFDARDHSRCIAYISDKALFNKKRAYVKDDCINIAIDIRALPQFLHETTEMYLRAQFTEISKLSKDSVYSEPTEYAGITWKMLMFKNIKDCIVFNLNVQKKDAVGWSCPVIADFRLISQKTGEVIHIESTKRIYDKERRTQWLGGMTNAKLFDEGIGYVEDDSIMVDVVIRAFPIN